jgi:hypothetical protein
VEPDFQTAGEVLVDRLLSVIAGCRGQEARAGAAVAEEAAVDLGLARLIALLATYPVYFSFNLIIHEIVTDDLATCGSVPLSMGLILSGRADQTACPCALARHLCGKRAISGALDSDAFRAAPDLSRMAIPFRATVYHHRGAIILSEGRYTQKFGDRTVPFARL